jgi:transposase InsO family protein
MAWRSVKVEDQRLKFVTDCLEGKLTMAELCRMYEISPKNGYKWVKRYVEEGIDGLKDRSRAPHSQALKISNEIVQKILDTRFQYPSWGPKKVLAYLESHYPDTPWPSTTSIGNLFDKNGLTVPRKLRKRVPGRTTPLSHCLLSNDVWCGDFKGWFLTGDGAKCNPFTITDGASRFLIRCVNLDHGDTEHVWAVLGAAFREYGLPTYFRTDNGPPFGSCGAGRISKLSINLIKVGVIPEWIDPGKPQQNGRHERMHLTLKNETATPSKPTLEEQSMCFKTFRHYYNYIRPHEALGQETPGSIYQQSPRIWNGKLQAPEYSKEYIIRKVRASGQISIKPFAPDINIGSALIGEYVGLKQTAEELYEVYYGPILLGKIDRTKKLITPPGNKRRRV